MPIHPHVQLVTSSLQLITSISLFYLTWIRFAWRNVNSCFGIIRAATSRKTRQITRLAKRKTNINTQQQKKHTHKDCCRKNTHCFMGANAHQNTTLLFTRACKTRHDNIYDLLTHTPFERTSDKSWLSSAKV